MTTVTLTTAIKLSAEQQKTIAKAIEKAIDDSVTITAEVDPAVIGGIRIRAGSLLLDGTVATKLTTLKQSLLTLGKG